MRKHLLGLTLIAGLAGCSSEQDPDGMGASLPTVEAGVAADSVPTQASLAALRGSAASFASLPDRGELLAYDHNRKSRKSGAYSYYPVSLSEAHALNAIANDGMVVNLPDGKALQLAYQTHEEQPDGNWTWIGRNDDGSTAVLTFGDKAVFGMISNGDDYYRVRTDRSGAWVVATDPSLVAAGGGRREDGHDYLMPGESGIMTAAASRRVAKVVPGVTGKAAAVVDVLVGYSSGLAAAYGGSSQAATFVTSLVSITNQAYANSGINMRVRLVHSLQVNYGDDSDNQDALQQMTGYDADAQQPIPVNSAFTALRDARDEHGADLVAFVRDYREPQQDGCGIAWLLGMNQSGITADDAEFGYAVISDGEDTDESDGNTYFCSDYSLAHELGHLMGQAHNQDDASAGGAHIDSYGYRESSAGGFFTIMAYPSDNAYVEIPNFANPAVKVAGRPTGVANQSNNVRSMNLTMPEIARFRATVVPLLNVRGDIDGDGQADIVFRHSGNGQNVIWKSANRATQEAMVTTSDQAWTVAAIGDLTGDGKADVVWRHATTGQNVVWPSGKRQQQQVLTSVADQNWKIVGIGDFDGDGTDDLLWRNSSTGANAIWRSGQRSQQWAVDPVSNINWKVVGVGDFNGDGRADILWRDVATGSNVIWRGGSRSAQQQMTAVTNTDWVVVGNGDFDGNGVDDVLWRNVATGSNTIWRDADRDNQQSVVAVNLQWSVAAVGDFNGDGNADIFWRNLTNGNNVYWRSGNRDTQQWVNPVANLDWKVVN